MDPETKKKWSEEVDEILESRYPFISDNYRRIRDVLHTGYGWHEFDLLRIEICLALMIGLYQAAITLTNHFLESLLKTALMTKDAFDKGVEEQDAEKGTVQSLIDTYGPSIDKYDSQDLGKNINAACSSGLITKKQKEQLHEFRKGFRNAYSHSDRKKTFGESTVPVQAGRLVDGQLQLDERQETRIAELMIGKGLFQEQHAKANAIPYFLYLDKLTRQLYAKLFPDEQN